MSAQKNANHSLTFDLSKANPKQVRFFRATNRYIAYGGARGGGKSWALRYKAAMLAMNYPGIKMLLLRRTYRDLTRNHVRELIPMLSGVAVYSAQDKVFKFLNDSILELGYCASESDVLQYQGQEYDVIFIDEATQFTEFQYETLTASLRGANDFPKRMYLTCNPGGVGHEWVKRLFVSKRYRDTENPDEYVFIPATVFDNKVIMEKDPGYFNMLNNLSDGLREAWRDGNWDMLAGRYFEEFDRNVHVVEPFPIPDHWRRYRAIDYGLDCAACVWAAVDERGQCYIYREYAEENKIISKAAEDICRLSGKGEEWEERYDITIAPPDLWSRSKESAKTVAELFYESGLTLSRGSNNREAGWLAIKELLRVREVEDGTKMSRLKIFSTCRDLIEQLPALQRDRKRPTDCLTEPHEITHLPDALRYFAVSYTNPAKEPPKELTMIAKHEQRLLRAARRRGYR